MNQINANAPTPDEIMELARENERLKGVIEAMESIRAKFAIEQQITALDEVKNKLIKKASEMPYQLECRSKGVELLQLGDVLCKRADRRIRATAQPH